MYLQTKPNDVNPQKAHYMRLVNQIWERHQKLFKAYCPFLAQRKQYLRDIQNLIRESISLQAQSFGEWRTREFISDDPDYEPLVDFAPQLYYKVLPCEIVFDIETLDKTNLEKCVSALQSFKIEPLVALSGNRGYHIHVFVTPQNMPIYKFVEHPQASELTIETFHFLCDHLETKNVEKIDFQVRCKHWIRCLYSLNVKDGKVGIKKPLNNPEIKVWEIPLSLIETLKVRRELRKELEELSTSDMNCDRDISRDTLLKALKALEPFKAREYSHYIAYHCPFHPPDKNPSFTFWKKAGIFRDWHDGKTYNAFTLLKALKRGEEK